MKKNILAAFIVFGVIALFLFAPFNQKNVEKTHQKKLRLAGSTTVFPFSQKVVDAYSKKHPDITFENTQSSSSKGIKKLLEGEADIARISRNLKEKEIKAASKNGRFIQSFQVGYDGIGVAVHPEKIKWIKQLDEKKIKKIFFTGKIKNWSQIHPKLSGKINVYVRDEKDSGTAELFKYWIFKGAKTNLSYHSRSKKVDRTDLIVQAISNDKNGIGAIPFIQANQKIALVPLTGTDGSAVDCTEKNIRKGHYPLTRDLFFVTDFPPPAIVAEFLEFTLSDLGQNLAAEVGNIPAASEIVHE